MGKTVQQLGSAQLYDIHSSSCASCLNMRNGTPAFPPKSQSSQDRTISRVFCRDRPGRRPRSTQSITNACGQDEGAKALATIGPQRKYLLPSRYDPRFDRRMTPTCQDWSRFHSWPASRDWSPIGWHFIKREFMEPLDSPPPLLTYWVGQAPSGLGAIDQRDLHFGHAARRHDRQTERLNP